MMIPKPLQDQNYPGNLCKHKFLGPSQNYRIRTLGTCGLGISVFTVL